jgi:hypothetical protein
MRSAFGRALSVAFFSHEEVVSVVETQLLDDVDGDNIKLISVYQF